MIKKVEGFFSSYFQRNHCVVLGSGTSALYTGLKACGITDGKKVLYPDMTCETSVNASVFSGADPLFCDIDRSSFNSTSKEISGVLDSYDAVVAIHIFGRITDTDNISGLTDAIVIEDAAQGYGGERDGVKTCSSGLFSILSTGKGKLFDCGGGGVLLTNDASFAKECRKVEKEVREKTGQSEAQRRIFMQEMFKLTKSINKKATLFSKRQQMLKDHKYAYLFPPSENVIKNMVNKIESFDYVVENRVESAAVLIDKLSGTKGISLQDIRKGEAPWKFSFLADPEKRDKLMTALQKSGFNVSKFFLPLHRIYNLEGAGFENTQYVYDRIINLTFDFDVSKAEQKADMITEIMHEY